MDRSPSQDFKAKQHSNKNSHTYHSRTQGPEKDVLQYMPKLFLIGLKLIVGPEVKRFS